MASLKFCYYDFNENEIKYKNCELYESPRICAHCNNTGEQKCVSQILTPSKRDRAKGILFTSCQYCGATSWHYLEEDLVTGSYTLLKIKESFPKNNLTTEIPPAIKENFPDFVKIYNQAQIAEKSDLDQLAGMGYRKAIEFLITDYLILYPINGVTKEWLNSPNTSLSQKIEKLEDARIKDLAKAISYLGNDETHYNKRHPDFNLEHLKMFIKAFLSDIDNHMIHQQAKELINKPKS